MEYYEVGSDYVSRALRYELTGKTINIVFDSGYVAELKLVYPTDNIIWDLGLTSQIEEIPDKQAFFYEVGFVETELPENAMYLVPTIKISEGEQ